MKNYRMYITKIEKEVIDIVATDMADVEFEFGQLQSFYEEDPAMTVTLEKVVEIEPIPGENVRKY